MDNIIRALEKFIASPMRIYDLGSKKPDKDFIQDKECLICLESLEINKIVKLPCECSNSVYHISCIIKLLQSGVNKNVNFEAVLEGTYGKEASKYLKIHS